MRVERKKKMKKKTITVLFFILFFTQPPTPNLQPCAYAAVENVRVTAQAYPSKVTIGDEIRLVIQVERPRKFIVDTPTDKLNLSPFEIKRVEISPVPRGKNRVSEVFTAVLTVFEIGNLKIPAFPVGYHTESGTAKQIMTEPIAVQVASVGKRSTDKDDIRPIKGPEFFDLSFIQRWFLGILAAALAILLVVKIILRRRKKQVDPESLLPAAERARRELERLKIKGYLEERKPKEFYSELSNILRRYFERQHSMIALELTTDEMLLQLKEKPFDRSIVEKIKQVLQDCDLVKFAKYEPPVAWAADLESKILEILEATEPEIEKKEVR